MSVRPNFYVLLELDPGIEDLQAIEQRLVEKQRRWSQDSTQSNPADQRKASFYLTLINDIRTTLSDPESRREEARIARVERDRLTEARGKELDAKLLLLRAEGKCSTETVRLLVKQLDGAFTEQQVTERLCQAGISIADEANRPKTHTKERLDPAASNVRKMAPNRIYGIDLGATYSCIAYVDENGRPLVVPNDENEMTTPSVVYFEGPDSIIVGNTAKEQTEIMPERCVSIVSRHMGNPDWEFAADGEVYKPHEISSFILRKVVKDAEGITGDTIRDVVITCPAYFGLNQKAATKQAGALAGLNVLYVIPEPTAAAIAYGMEQETDQTILVYHLGGATFDVTLIRVAVGEITFLTTGGDDKLGGRNWDEALLDYLAHGFQAETGIPTNAVTANRATYQRLLNSAEQAKKKLSSAQGTKVRVRHDADFAIIEVTRQKFDEITALYLDRTISLTKDLLALAAAKGHSALDKVLLVGGSCHMPQVLARVTKEFPVEVKIFEPSQAVAKGAAIFGFKCFLEREKDGREAR